MKINKTILSLGLTAFVVAGSLSLQGCYGSFNLTKKVYNWNGTLGNKWIKSLLFIVLSPVYGIAVTVDAIAFNLVEFWTGSNPVTSAQNTMDKTYANGTKVHAERLVDGRLSVQITGPTGEASSFVLTHEADGISAADVQGNWLGKVAETDHGTVVIQPKVALAR